MRSSTTTSAPQSPSSESGFPNAEKTPTPARTTSEPRKPQRSKYSQALRKAVDDLDLSPLQTFYPDQHLEIDLLDLHDSLDILANIVLPEPSEQPYEQNKKIVLTRFLAGVHLALCGPLPNMHGIEPRTIVGCPHCRNRFDPQKREMSLPLFLAFAAFRGVIDPWYDPGGRESSVRLTWRVDSGDQQAELVSTLTRGRFAVAINPGFGIVVAQKPLDTHDIDIAIEWAVKQFPQLKEDGLEWFGAEPIFRSDRSPLEMSHLWIVGGHKQQPEKSRKPSADLPENPF